ncbi:MAG: GNAT family N-acetyltransferase [Clostridia bacterium]
MDENKKKIVRVLPYDPQWKEEFQKIKGMLDEIIGILALGIEHVGSTAVEGLAAKPIIDIDVVMESYRDFTPIKTRLEQAGFVHEGNLGVDDREAFKRIIPDAFMPYHLYVCPKDGKGYLDHILFRDHLREHPDDAREYGTLKMHLASRHRNDMKGYMKGKEAFIQGIMGGRSGPFAFLDYNHLSDGEIDLRIIKKKKADVLRNHVPAYVYEILIHGSGEPVGRIALRIGDNESIYYGGHIGYEIMESHRGKGYAGKACLLVAQVAKAHGRKKLIVTCNPDNHSSRRCCEKLGAQLLEIVDIPEYNAMYQKGERQKCRYLLVI